MLLVGLAGRLRVGKDTIADYLVETHDFLKFSFSDALYNEVQKAYGLADQQVLRGVDTKEVDIPYLALSQCDNEDFRQACANAVFGSSDIGPAEYSDFLRAPRSPRWVLQMWGTEYRRKENPHYWVARADDFIEAFFRQREAAHSKVARGEELTEVETTLLRINGLVNTSVRFTNECEFIRDRGGEVWHVRRREADAKYKSTHVAEAGDLPVTKDDREIYNNGSIEKLHTGISLLVSGATKVIYVED